MKNYGLVLRVGFQRRHGVISQLNRNQWLLSEDITIRCWAAVLDVWRDTCVLLMMVRKAY